MYQTRSKTDFIVVHCAATRSTQDIGRKEIDAMHRQRGFSSIGYHYVIRRNGVVELGRPTNTIGAHVLGFNDRSIGICMVGGVAADGKTVEDNFTSAQFATLAAMLPTLQAQYPGARITSHRDLSPDKNRNGKIEPNEWLKGCPSFDITAFLQVRGIDNIS